MTSTPPPGTATIDPDAAGVLARTAEHLESSYALACAAAGSDLLSPWAALAMSIHLAAATLSRHLSEPAGASHHPDCLSALRAADTELTQLPPDHQIALEELALIHTRLATAISEAQPRQEISPTTTSATGSASEMDAAQS